MQHAEIGFSARSSVRAALKKWLARMDRRCAKHATCCITLAKSWRSLGHIDRHFSSAFDENGYATFTAVKRRRACAAFAQNCLRHRRATRSFADRFSASRLLALGSPRVVRGAEKRGSDES